MESPRKRQRPPVHERGDPPAEKRDPAVKRRYVLRCGGRWVANSDTGSLTESFEAAESHDYETEAQLALRLVLDAYERHDPPMACEVVRIETKTLTSVTTGKRDETARGTYRVARSRKG